MSKRAIPLYSRFLSSSAFVLSREIHDPPRSSSPRLDVKASRLSTRLRGRGWLLSERGPSRVGKDCVRSPIDTLPVYAPRDDERRGVHNPPATLLVRVQGQPGMGTQSRNALHAIAILFFFSLPPPFFIARGMIRRKNFISLKCAQCG